MRSRNGFTMSELMIVIAIMAMMISVSVGSSLIFQRQGIARTHSSIHQVLIEASMRSRFNVDDTMWGVYFLYDEPTGRARDVILFTGPSYSERDTSNDLSMTVNRSILFDFSLVDLGEVTSGNEVVFEQFTGDSQQSGIISIESKGAESVILIQGNGIPVYEKR